MKFTRLFSANGGARFVVARVVTLSGGPGVVQHRAGRAPFRTPSNPSPTVPPQERARRTPSRDARQTCDAILPPRRFSSRRSCSSRRLAPAPTARASAITLDSTRSGPRRPGTTSRSSPRITARRARLGIRPTASRSGPTPSPSPAGAAIRGATWIPRARMRRNPPSCPASTGPPTRAPNPPPRARTSARAPAATPAFPSPTQPTATEPSSPPITANRARRGRRTTAPRCASSSPSAVVWTIGPAERVRPFTPPARRGRRRRGHLAPPFALDRR